MTKTITLQEAIDREMPKGTTEREDFDNEVAKEIAEENNRVDRERAKKYKDVNWYKEKSPERVKDLWLKYPTDWRAQYNMLLDDGITCGDCYHSKRCKLIFGGNDSNTSCQFHPNRFTSETI